MTDSKAPTDAKCENCGHPRSEHRLTDDMGYLCFHMGENGRKYCSCFGYVPTPPLLNNRNSSFPAYAAGFFDGEGCVTILRYKQTNRANAGYRLHARIVQKHQNPLNAIVSAMGYGKVYKMKGVVQSQDGFQLQFTGIEAVNFLQTILPYLILKRDQVLLGLEYYEKTRWDRSDGYRVSDEMNTLRESYYKRLQAMKKESDND